MELISNLVFEQTTSKMSSSSDWTMEPVEMASDEEGFNSERYSLLYRLIKKRRAIETDADDECSDADDLIGAAIELNARRRVLTKKHQRKKPKNKCRRNGSRKSKKKTKESE